MMMPGLLLMVVLTGSVAWAQEEEFDIENVPTPVLLKELLPAGGIDAVDVDYWLCMQMTDADGQVLGNQSYHHWSIKPVEGRLVFTYQMGYTGVNGYHKLRRSVYEADGSLVSYQDQMVRSTGSLRTVTGQVVDDQLVLETTTDVEAGIQAPADQRRKVPLKVFEEALSPDWLPLVLAYHVRRGSLGFGYATVDVSRNNEKIQSAVENLGSEQVQVAGAMVDAHLLRVKKSIDGKDDGQVNATMFVLADGSVWSMTNRTKKMRMDFRRSTAEEVSKEFSLDQVQFDLKP